jgi:hypothetical protein
LRKAAIPARVGRWRSTSPFSPTQPPSTPRGKLNILGVFDRISASDFPAKHGRISLVLRFAAGIQEAGGHEVEIRLLDPDGQEVVQLSGSMRLGPGPRHDGGRIKVPHVLHLDGLVFKVPGHYTFDVRVDGEVMTSLPLSLVSSAAQTAQA